MGRRLTAAIVAHPIVTAALLLGALAVAVMGISRLSVDMSSASFYADDGPEAVALREYQARWGPDDARLVVLVRRDDGPVTDAPARGSLRALQDDLAAVDGVTDAWGLGAVPGFATGLQDRMRAARIVSADDTATVVLVDLARSSDDALATAEVVDRIEGVLDAHRTEGWTLTAAGLPAVRAAFVRLAIGDQLRLQPLVFAVIAIGLAIAFRRLHAVVVPSVAAAIPGAWLAGGLGLVGEPLGLLNQVLLTLLPVVAVADAVHWVARYHEHLLAHEGPLDAAAHRAAIVDTGATVGTACGWTSLTTAAGFASLALSDMPILRNFGGWGAAGIGLAWLAVAVVVPLGLSLSHAGPPPRTDRPELGRRLQTHARWISAAGIALAVAAGIVAARADVDNRLSDLLPADHPVAQANAFIDRELTGTLALEVEALGDPARLRAARDRLSALQDWAEADPRVRTTVGPRDAFSPVEVWVPDEGRARVRLFVADAGGRSFAALVDDVQARLPEIDGLDLHLTGTTRMAYAGVNRITSDLRTSLAGMLVVVSLVTAIAVRRLDWALASLVVNAWPLVVGLGAVALFGPLDPLAVVVVTVGLGLAVDDTIHVLTRAREEGGDAAAVRRALSTSGVAVTITSAVLAVGLGLGVLSSFPPLRMLGTLGAAVIAAAWIGDVVLLPALLALRGRGS